MYVCTAWPQRIKLTDVNDVFLTSDVRMSLTDPCRILSDGQMEIFPRECFFLFSDLVLIKQFGSGSQMGTSLSGNTTLAQTLGNLKNNPDA